MAVAQLRDICSGRWVGGHGVQPVPLDAGKEELRGCSCSGQVGRVAMGLCVHVGDQSQSGGVGG